MNILSRPNRRGFSLFELLMSLSIISILAALAVAFASDDSGVSPAIAQANARQVMNVYTSARAYGVTFKSKTPEGIISEMVNGVKPPKSDTSFRLTMHPEYIGVAAKHLEFVGGELRLRSEKNQTEVLSN